MRKKINFVVLLFLSVIFFIDCYLILYYHSFIKNDILISLITLTAGISAIFIPVFLVFSIIDLYRQWRIKS